MQFGVHIFPTEHSIQPDELARAAEDRGLESVWFSEHTHIPVRFLNTSQGQQLPDYYWQTYDVFLAMTLAATATQNIKVASGVCLVIERDAILLAKEVATLDHISKGRFLFGVGAGWLEAEMADHGVAYRTRFQLLKEQIRAMQNIWTSGESEFHGKFVQFDKMRAFPKPYQLPHPPIIMGGGGPKAIKCAARVCDGWAPWNMEWSEAKEAIAQVRQLSAENGRDPNSVEISLFELSIPKEEAVAEMEMIGVKRIILTIFAQGHDEALRNLDLLAKMSHS